MIDVIRFITGSNLSLRGHVFSLYTCFCEHVAGPKVNRGNSLGPRQSQLFDGWIAALFEMRLSGLLSSLGTVLINS